MRTSKHQSEGCVCACHRIKGSVCAHHHSLPLLCLPSPVAQVILQRMDRLSPRAQLCLKVASVMGQVVDAEVLRRFHPLRMSK